MAAGSATHTALAQTWPGAQTLPQLPQLPGCELRSKHRVPHRLSVGSGHESSGVLQTPASQSCPTAQTTSQLPQWEVLVFKS